MRQGQKIKTFRSALSAGKHSDKPPSYDHIPDKLQLVHKAW